MESETAAIYSRFAEYEAHGVSDVYFDWATSIADDPAVRELISTLPRLKRQANLVFAAARWAGASVGAYDTFRAWLPADAHVVVFHSAVLAYLDADGRRGFVELMGSLAHVTWVSNEGTGVFPAITEKASDPDPREFLLAVDGEPVATTGPHGQSYRALAR